jgi:hypothetical protein
LSGLIIFDGVIGLTIANVLVGEVHFGDSHKVLFVFEVAGLQVVARVEDVGLEDWLLSRGGDLGGRALLDVAVLLLGGHWGVFLFLVTAAHNFY